MTFAGKLARLEELRRGLSALVPRAAPMERSPRARNESGLPFEALADPDGVVHRRRFTRPLSHAIGCMELGAAARADALMLSLLALTPPLAGCRLERALFLDIETTGFGNGTGNYAFLVGVGFFERGGLTIEQYLLRDPSDEGALLERLGAHLRAAELIVSYNGKSFDVPVMRSRFVMNRRALPAERPHLDLLHLARRVHKARSFRKALGTLEQLVLGYRRGLDVSGAEVAARYAHFLRTGDDGELREVVTHNERDVLTLVALTGLYGEPLERLPAEDLAAAAQVMQRAGDLERARAWADEAVRRDARSVARHPFPLRVRAAIAKARGERDRALADFEELARCVDDARVRLELAKLYEHYVRDPGRALELVAAGTGETATKEARRRSRLLRKLDQASHPTHSWARVGR